MFYFPAFLSDWLSLVLSNFRLAMHCVSLDDIWSNSCLGFLLLVKSMTLIVLLTGRPKWISVRHFCTVQLHRHRFRNGLAVFDALDLGPSFLFLLRCYFNLLLQFGECFCNFCGLHAEWQFWLIFLARDPALDCVIHQHVGEPIHLTLSAAGIYAGKSLTTMGNFGYQSICGIFLCSREEVLSAPRVLLVLKA